MRWYYMTWIAVAAATTLACSEEDVNSSAIRTSGINATFELVGNGTSTEVTVVLKVGGDGSRATVIDLDGDDEMVVTSGDETRTMSGKNGDYSVTMSGSDDDQAFTMAFNRGPEDDGAPSTTATLPAGFTLAGIDSGEEISRAGAAEVTWDPSGTGDDMTWSLDGDCLWEQSGTMGDTGSMDITASNYDVQLNEEDTTCEATLTIDRLRDGSLDPHFGEGGDVVAIQRRSITFQSAP
jgi:hypothetical protein